MDTPLDQLKRAVMLKRLQQRNGARAAGTTIAQILPCDRSAPLALSWAQQRLWFLGQLDPAAGAAYHMPAGFRLQGSLLREVLQATLDRIVARHESLRTHFVNLDGQPNVRIAAPGVGFALREHDLSALDSAAQHAAIARINEDEASTPFDLGSGPLIRGRLLRLAVDEHILLLTQHHIVSDGWSTGVLIREVRALYGALSEGRADPLPALPIQYPDFAAWQRQWLHGDALQQQIAFWSAHLAGAPALLELPIDHPRPAQHSYAGARIDLALSPELCGRLRQLAQRHEATMFMVLLSAWGALMARLSGQQDIVIGTAFANRQRPELEPLIGLFVNTLALRMQCDPDASFAQLLKQVKTTALAAYANQDVPFEQVVEAVKPVRSMRHSPVFQVMFALNNTPSGGELQLPGLTLAPIATAHVTTHFDLSLGLSDTGATIAGALDYSTELFERATVERMITGFQALLAAMVEDDGRLVDTIALQTPAERMHVLADFNASAAPYPREQLVYQLFEAQAAARPDAVAMVCDAQALTYGELNRRANQLAHRLLAHGVKPDSRVALCVERGPEMIVGLLGVMKSGGAYVPLDPAYPTERLAHMLADCAPLVLVTQASLQERLATLGGQAGTLLLDAPDHRLDAQQEHNPDRHALGIRADHLAYVIYTSGSTGLPKGVAVTHANLANFIHSMRDTPGIVASDVVLSVTSISFDIAGLELYLPLTVGATTILATRQQAADAPVLARMLASHGVTMMQATPSTWRMLVDQPGWPQAGQSLKVLCGGEALSPDLLHRLLGRVATVWNLYGPTETTIWSTLKALSADDGRLTIGRPIANTQIYLLDRHQQPVPQGVAGEIHIGGEGVARGYLNRPKLTAERFLADPFSALPEARMYKTGDLGRYLADGDIEYLGRNDFQVKFRGYRIELGEIETTLMTCGGVRNALVVAREDTPGDQRLVAYVIAHDGAELDPGALRAELAATLADYMLPSAFVRMPCFPLTPNGKLDRRALPAPDQGDVAARAFAAPAGRLETALAAIWQELLGLPQVGRHDHFFELGGHSLLALQVVARLRHDIGIEIPVRAIFAHPTLADLASCVGAASGADGPPIVALERGALPALSLAQHRLWFLDQLDHAASAAYHLPAMLRLDGRLDLAALRATLERIVARHESLRTTFASVDGEPRQHIAAPDIGFSLQQHDLRALRGHEQQAAVERLCVDEASAAFDLAAGPLMRGQLLRLADDAHILLVTMHHIVSDGWSIGVLIREVNALYSAFSEGRADPLAPLAIQYADYAAWQRQRLQGELLDKQLDFWRTHLNGAPALLSLPTDRPRPALQSYAGNSVALHLSPALSAGLRALAQRHGATLFMTLLAGWAILLARLANQDQVVVGTPVANRQRREVEDLIGFFVNTLALRVRLDADPSVAELLAQVKGSTLDAFAHQDLPFEQVVEALRPERSMAHSPIFQSTLTWNNTPGELSLALPGLTLSSLPRAQRVSQFDLSASLADDGHCIVGQLSYASDLFEHSTAERIAGHFQTLLAAMVAAPQQRISALPLLSADERRHILVDFNATAASFPATPLFHQLFEAQAAARPDAIALVFDQQRLSYAELNGRANVLARQLLALGVKPDQRVALYVERGVAMVVGVLGILKAGAAYVPLDPAYPAGRLAHMLADSAPVVLLSETAQESGIAALGISGLQLPVLLLDAPDGARHGAGRDEGNIALADLAPANLAYVIYTSGSTGLPKGVAVSHANLLNFLHSMRCAPGIEANDILLGVTSMSFDIAALELYLPLTVGACTVLASRAAAADPQQLARLLVQHHVTLMQATPSTWRMLVEHGWPAQARRLKVLCGGEALPADLLQKLLQHVPCVWNMYGPTETTIWSTLRALRHDAQGPSIGRPIANTRVYILDRHGAPVPVGVAGEIHIAGAGVACAYLNQPELTAERFPSDPFSDDPAARMYRTGDLGRWRDDGNIECLGRVDHQIKLRGFRIEPGEIETALLQCPGVRGALVVAREHAAEHGRLVAYLLASAGVVPDPAQLRAALARTLADYMIPSAFVVLDSFPLTPNGKLDRHALPAPEHSNSAQRTHVAPVGATEAALSELWQEMLGEQQIGRHDNFFELGGHSLLATRLVARMTERFGRTLSLRALFDTPTICDLAVQLDAMGGAAALPATPAIMPVSRTDVLPLSYAQKRFWFLEQFQSDQGYYNMPLALTLRGRLDLAVFQRVFDALVQRHEPLRTIFSHDNGIPRQVILEPLPLQIMVHDLSGMEAAARGLEIEQRIAREAGQPFNLSEGPLIRTTLLRCDADEHIFLLTLHHILCDGWSMGVLVREFTVLYAAFERAAASPLPALPIQYADYTWWEQKHLDGDTLKQQLGYWKRELAGVPELLALPTDRARPAQRSYNGASHVVRLPAPLTAQLGALGRRQNATLFMVLSTAFNVLLHRYTGQDDLCIGALAANRPAQTESLIGIFLNIIALRSTVSAGDDFATLLARTRDRLLVAYEQQIPFELLLTHCAENRSAAYMPYAQVALNFRNEFDPQIALVANQDSTLSIANEHTGGTRHAHFEIKLDMALEHDGLRIDVEYNTDLFNQTTIARLTGHFMQLLDAIVATPERPLHDLPLFDEAERQDIVVGFNDTRVDYPPGRLVHQLFEQQVEAQPDAIALVCEEQRLTYAQLNRRANQLAHYLLSLGVKPDARVAICVERSIDMLVGLLGILKAGAAYVPLDPGYPPERLAYMLGDCQPMALLTQTALQGRLQAGSIPVLCLDGDCQAALALQDQHNPDPLQLGLTAQHLAYVIYTSGSTGQPKGAMNQHDGVVNRLLWAQDTFALQATDRVLQKTPFGFDVSVWEFFLPLLAGAQIVLARPAGHQDPRYLAELIASAGISVLHFVPSMLQAFIDQAPLASCRSIRHLLCSGEALPSPLLSRVRDLLPQAQLHNLYGPTEAAVDVTYWDCAEPPPCAGVPIGRPIANTQIYILDATRQPVPVGVAGEIHIGGIQVGRGYLNRPALTAEHFIDHPFGTPAHPRLYRTGDLGRYHADGTIEYLGRNDFQVKIRGLRIELGEIEATLSTCAAVREALVIAREDTPGDQRLVAYIVPHDGALVDAAALRTVLAATLADYMLPSAFVRMASLPLTPNGKLDRRALPAPDQSAVIAQAYLAPQGPTEAAIAHIWQELLGLERVGRHDNFFDLGGHSLLAVQLLVRIREQFEIDIELRTLFERPTLSQISEILTSSQIALFSATDIESLEDEIDSLSESELLLLASEGIANE